jgi:hypothetical protein
MAHAVCRSVLSWPCQAFELDGCRRVVGSASGSAHRTATRPPARCRRTARSARSAPPRGLLGTIGPPVRSRVPNIQVDDTVERLRHASLPSPTCPGPPGPLPPTAQVVTDPPAPATWPIATWRMPPDRVSRPHPDRVNPVHRPAKWRPNSTRSTVAFTSGRPPRTPGPRADGPACRRHGQDMVGGRAGPSPACSLSPWSWPLLPNGGSVPAPRPP